MESLPNDHAIQAEWDQFLARDKTRRYKIRPVAKPIGSEPQLKLTYHPCNLGMSRQQTRKQLTNMSRLYLWDKQQQVWLKRKNGSYLVVVDEDDILGKIQSAYVADPKCGIAIYDRLKTKYAGIPQRFCIKGVDLLKRLNSRQSHAAPTWRETALSQDDGDNDDGDNRDAERADSDSGDEEKIRLQHSLREVTSGLQAMQVC